MQLLENTFTGSVALVGSYNERRQQLHSPAHPVLFDGVKIADDCKNTPGIYYWENNLNGHGYVGRAKRFRRRIGEYARLSAISGQKKIYRALVKYGIQNFTCYKIMDCCPSDIALNYWETYWIKELDTFGDNGYNMTPGGSGFGSGKDHPMYGKPVSDKRRKQVGDRHRGKKLSDQTKMLVSQSRMGKCCGDKNPNFGKPMSEETKKRLSASLVGRKSPMKGKKLSNEHKYRMRKTKLLQHGTLYKEFFIFDEVKLYRGVKKECNRWSSRIQKCGKSFYLGMFQTPEEAALAYNKKAKELFGEFAYLNDVKL